MWLCEFIFFIYDLSVQDCEDAVLKKESVERENEILKERISALDKALQSSQEEMTNFRTKVFFILSFQSYTYSGT